MHSAWKTAFKVLIIFLFSQIRYLNIIITPLNYNLWLIHLIITYKFRNALAIPCVARFGTYKTGTRFTPFKILKRPVQSQYITKVSNFLHNICRIYVWTIIKVKINYYRYVRFDFDENKNSRDSGHMSRTRFTPTRFNQSD